MEHDVGRSEQDKMQRGFVDAHIHIRDRSGLGDVATAGIVAVRDAGTHQGAGLGIPAPGAQAEVPRVFSAGRALYKKGGYGSFLGVSVGTHEEIKAEILALKSEGAAIIKVIASGVVSLKKPGSITPGGFENEELALIVKEAGKYGLAVMAHANGEAAIIAAAEAGALSVEHGFFMTNKALDVMAKEGTFWTPTVGALARAADAKKISDEMKASLSELIQSHLTMIGRAWRMGIHLAIGTDCVLPDPAYRSLYDAELSYFEQAGISREDVLTIACEGGARLLGM